MKFNKLLLAGFIAGGSLLASSSALAQDDVLESVLADAVKASLAQTTAEIDSKIAIDVLSGNDVNLLLESEYQVTGTVTTPMLKEVETDIAIRAQEEGEKAE